MVDGQTVGVSGGPFQLGLPGTCALDSFIGANDDALLTSALSYAAAQTYKPTILFGNRAHTFTNTYPLSYNGLRISGPLGGMEREFRTTCMAACPSGGLFSFVNGVKDIAVRGISFQGSGQWMKTFPTDNSQGALTDFNLDHCGFFGFASVLTGTVLRAHIGDLYVNGATGTQLNLGGSDSTLFDGMCFMSGQLPANTPYVSLAMSASDVGRLYCTPQGGYALQITYSAGGLVIHDYMADGTGRSGSTATQQAGIQQTGGLDVIYDRIWVFNCNVAGTSKAQVTVTGGTAVFNMPRFPGANGTTKNGWVGPAIYTTVPIRVCSPRASNGGNPVLQQASAGLITCDDPTWQILTAA